MAVGVWTTLALPANATGHLEYRLDPDGFVHLRGEVTHVGATFLSVDVVLPAEATPLYVPMYFDWTGSAADANILVYGFLSFGGSNFGAPGKTWTAAEVAAVSWRAATLPTPATQVHAAIYDRLIGDATLVADLATYQGTAAVFSAPPIPEDATLPAVVIEAPDDERPSDTKTTLGRSVTRAVTVYADASGDIALVERLAARVVALFHRQPLGPSGTLPWRLEASGPGVVPTDGTLYARRIVLEMAW